MIKLNDEMVTNFFGTITEKDLKGVIISFKVQTELINCGPPLPPRLLISAPEKMLPKEFKRLLLNVRSALTENDKPVTIDPRESINQIFIDIDEKKFEEMRAQILRRRVSVQEEVTTTTTTTTTAKRHVIGEEIHVNVQRTDKFSGLDPDVVHAVRFLHHFGLSDSSAVKDGDNLKISFPEDKDGVRIFECMTLCDQKDIPYEINEKGKPEEKFLIIPYERRLFDIHSQIEDTEEIDINFKNLTPKQKLAYMLHYTDVNLLQALVKSAMVRFPELVSGTKVSAITIAAIEGSGMAVVKKSDPYQVAGSTVGLKPVRQEQFEELLKTP